MNELADGDDTFLQQLDTARRRDAANTVHLASYRQLLDEIRTGLDNLAVEMAKLQEDGGANWGADDERDSRELVQFEGSLKKLGSYNDMLEMELNRTIKEKDGTIFELKHDTEHYKQKVARLQNVLKEKEEIIQRLNERPNGASSSSIPRKVCCTHECANAGATVSLSGSCQLPHPVTEHELLDMRTELDLVRAQNHELRLQYEESRRQECFLQNDCKKLNNELILSKRSQKELRDQLAYVQSLLRKQEDSRMELLRNWQEIGKKYEEQSKHLCATNAKLKTLDDSFKSLERQRSTYAVEMDELRDELHTMKEKNATLLGKKSSLEDQVQHCEEDIHHLHNKLKEERNAHLCHKNKAEKQIADLQASMLAQKRKHALLQKELKERQDELREMAEHREQAERLIASFRKWRAEQTKSDSTMKKSMEEYDQHIKLLLKEKQEFLEDYRKLHHEYSTLQYELDRLKMCRTTRPPIALSNNIEYAMQSSTQLARHAENIRRTSQMIHDCTDALTQDREQMQTRHGTASNHTSRNIATTNTNRNKSTSSTNTDT